MPGPLQGLRVVEMAGLGPCPHAAMVLADLGADVVRVDRPDGRFDLSAPERDVLLRGRRSVAADLKTPEGVALVLDARRAGRRAARGLPAGRHGAARPRPGRVRRAQPAAGLRADHRLGAGRAAGAAGRARPQLPRASPARCRRSAARGSAGAAAEPGRRLRRRLDAAARRRARRPAGAARARAAARWSTPRWSTASRCSARCSGRSAAQGFWADERGTNALDGGAPFYDVYPCADGRFVAVGAIEPQFFARLCEVLGLDQEGRPHYTDPAGWPAWREAIGAALLTRTRDAWTAAFDGVDACVTPVVELAEALDEPHLAAAAPGRSSTGCSRPPPRPASPGRRRRSPAAPRPPGADTAAVLADWTPPG